MNDLCRYRVQVAGQVDEHEVNATSPLEIKVERDAAESTWLSVHTDQSGLIGLMRHLHGLGFVFLCVDRAE
jgi:hypothetical protein